MTKIKSQREFETYQAILMYEYQIRRKRNPQYSLRAFARDLGISPSRLSEIISGKQGLSSHRARDVGSKIGYRLKKLDWFCNLAESHHARNQLAKKLAEEKLKNYRNGVLSQEVSKPLPFELKWYHLAIRRMTLLEGFKSDSIWISKKLKLPLIKVECALKEMLDIGFLEYDLQGNLCFVKNLHFCIKNQKKEATDKIAAFLHYKSYKSRKSSNILNMNHNGNHLFTFNKDQIQELRELINDFEDKLDNLTYKAKSHTDLMGLVISFFPLLD